MPTNISVEKIKEVIRLAERAGADPAGRADDPQRGGQAGSAGVDSPQTPSVPQPDADWRCAFERYVSDLPDAALDEMVSLYRTGGGGAGEGQDIGAGPSSADAPDFDRAGYLLSRPDLAQRLQAAVKRL
jgi:hypothetical protein